MSQKNDPLASLIVSDAKATDRKKLAQLLQPFVAIDEESKEFTFHDAFHEIKSNPQKIEIILAAAKARALFFEQEEDGTTQKELIGLGILPEGSVKTALKKLYDSHRIKKDHKSRYTIPGYRISDLPKHLLNQP